MEISDKDMVQRIIDYVSRSENMEDMDILAVGYVIGLCSRYGEALKRIDNTHSLNMAKEIAKAALNA